ncbi:SymE family type I addiction module toxin, partial [Xanthomonas campestris]
TSGKHRYHQPRTLNQAATQGGGTSNAADLAKQQRAPRRPRPPQQLTVGYGYYTASSQRIPTLRLRGRWLEQLGFAIGSKLNIRMRDGELVVSVADKD